MYQDLGVRIVVLGAGEARRNIGMVRSDLNLLENTIRKVSGSTSTLGANLTRLGSAMSSLGRTLTVSLTTPLLALGGALVGTGISFEDAFAGIGKTVDGVSVGFKEIIQMTPTLNDQVAQLQATMSLAEGRGVSWEEAFNRLVLTMSDTTKASIFADSRFGQLTAAGINLRNEYRALALELPISANALADIGRVAGQMGVPADQLIAFTRVVAELGVATNIAGDDAAFAIARTANIFGVSGDQMGEFALSFSSALVDLGNSTAATESEILNISTRMAAAGQIAGMSVPDILGWGSAMAEMGVRSERGGTAFSRVIYEMIDAVGQGGDNLEQFAAIAGVSAEDFAKTFKENPTKALEIFLPKLAELQERGLISADTLTELGFEGIRVREVMNLLGPNMELVTENIDKANTAWQQQIALEQEARKKFATTAAKIKLVKNAFVDLGITIFDLYKNKIDRLLDRLKTLLNSFNKLPEATQRWVVTLGLLAAAAGPVLVILGTLLQNLGVVVSFFTSIPSVIWGVISAFASLLPVILPIVAIAGALYLAWKENIGGIQNVVRYLVGSFKQSGILNFVNNIIDSLKTGDFNSAFDNLKNAYNATVDWFNTRGKPALESAIDGIKTSIESKLEGLKNTIEDKLGRTSTPLLGGLGSAGKGLIEFANGVGGFFDAFSETRTKGFNEVWKIFLIFVGLIASAFGAGLKALAPVLPDIGAGISEIISAVSDWLEVNEPSIKLIEFLNDLNKALKDLPDNAFKKVGEGLSQLNAESILFLGIVLAPLVTILGNLALKMVLMSVIVPIFSAALTILEGVLALLIHTIIPALLPVLLLAGVFLTLKNNTFGITDNIREVGKHFSEIKDAIGDGRWVDALKNFGGAVGDIVITLLKLPFGIATEFVDGITKLAGIDFNAEERIKGWQPFVDFLSIKLKGAIDDITSQFDADNPDSFVSKISALPQDISNAVSGLDIDGWITKPFRDAGINIKLDFFDKIIKDIGEFPKRIVDGAKDIGKALEENLYKPFAEWLGKIGGLFDPILDALDKIGSFLGLASGTVQISTSGVVGSGPDIPSPAVGEHAKGGTFSGWSWVGEKGPELMYSPRQIGVLSNPLSKLLTNLINPPASSATYNNTRNNNYSPTFNAAPTSDMLRANRSLYEEWLYGV